MREKRKLRLLELLIRFDKNLVGLVELYANPVPVLFSKASNNPRVQISMDQKTANLTPSNNMDHREGRVEVIFLYGSHTVGQIKSEWRVHIQHSDAWQIGLSDLGRFYPFAPLHMTLREFNDQGECCTCQNFDYPWRHTHPNLLSEKDVYLDRDLVLRFLEDDRSVQVTIHPTPNTLYRKPIEIAICPILISSFRPSSSFPKKHRSLSLTNSYVLNCLT